MSPIASAREAFSSYHRGSPSELLSLEHELKGSDSPEARPWLLAINASRWLSGVSREPLPELTEAQKLHRERGAESEGLAELCRVMARASVLSFDVDALSEWQLLHAALTSPNPDHYEWYRAQALWLDLMTGKPSVARESQQRLADTEHELSPELAAEFSTLAALGLLMAGDLDRALEFARGAVEIARAEGLLEWHALATIAQARVFRYRGVPYVAALLLEELSRKAPTPFRAWVAWETLLASGHAASILNGEGLDSAQQTSCPSVHRAWSAVYRLSDMLEAPSPVAFQAALLAVREAVGAVVPLSYEVELVGAALDYSAPPPKHLRSWCWGQEALPPAGLFGVQANGDGPYDATSLVILRKGQVGRRVLARALHHVVGSTEGGWVELRGSPQQQNSLSALALADHQELTHADLFRQSLGTEYVPRLHRSLLLRLLERTSQLLGSHGRLLSLKGSVRLIVTIETLVLPDLRTARPHLETVLRSLTHDGPGTCQELSERLDLPLRVVERSLETLRQLAVITCSTEGQGANYALLPDLGQFPATGQSPEVLPSGSPSRKTGT